MTTPAAENIAESHVRHSAAAGVKSDFATLLGKFAETNMVRYAEFATLWSDRKMSLIFAGRQEDRECREFIEESMNIAVGFWMPPYSFQARIGGLYLLYALYFKQVVIPKVKIRLTIEQWNNIQSFLEEVREQQHFDVEYVYHKLHFNKAFQFTAAEKEKVLELRDSTAGDDSRSHLLSEALTQRKSILSEVMEQEATEHLSTVHEQYQRMKCLLAGPDTKKPHPSVDIIQTNLVQYITKAVATHEEWQRKKASRKYGRQRRDSGSTSESEEGSDVDWTPRKQTSSIGERRAQLKAQAFAAVSTASRSRRHRQVIKEETEEAPSKKRGRKAKGYSSDSPWSQDDASPGRKKVRTRKISEGSSGQDTPVGTPATLDIYAIGAMMASPEKSPQTEPTPKRKRGRPPKKSVSSAQSKDISPVKPDMDSTLDSTDEPEQKVLPISSGEEDSFKVSPKGSGRGRGRPKGRGKDRKGQDFECTVLNSPDASTSVDTVKGRGARGKSRKNEDTKDFECDIINSPEVTVSVDTVRGKGRGRGRPRKSEDTKNFERNITSSPPSATESGRGRGKKRRQGRPRRK